MRTASWLYRTLLLVLPRGFRQEAAVEMSSTFDEALDRAATRGWWAGVRVVAVGLVDLAVTSLNEWNRPFRGAGGPLEACRMLWRSKGFAAAAVATFALGMGVNLAVLSVVDRMLFRPLPYADADRLVHLYSLRSSSGPSPEMFMSMALSRRLEGSSAFEHLASVGGFSKATSFDDFGSLSLDRVSWNLLPVLGVRPVAGRDLASGDVGGSILPILLRDEVWARRFDRSPDVFSKSLVSGRTSYRVVGILPPGLLVPASTFTGPSDGVVLDSRSGTPPHFAELGPSVVARLRPGVTRAQAQADVDHAQNQLSEEFPQAVLLKQPVKVNEVRAGIFGLYRSRAWLIVAAVALVWTVACVNLLTLLLARGRSRERDAAVRSALGASRWQVIRGELLEALIVCVLGTLLAIAACALSYEGLMTIVPATLRSVAASPLDVRLLLISGTATMVAALMAGVLPALRASSADVTRGLRLDPRSTVGRLRGGATLLAIEAALGVLLVAGAAATVRSFFGAAFKDPGYDTANLIELGVQHGNKGAAAGYDPQRVTVALDIIRGFGGVLSAGPATKLPMGTKLASNDAFWKSAGVDGNRFGVGDGFFATLGTPLLAGREFSADEVRGRAPVVLVNRRGANVLWPGVPLNELIGKSVSTKTGPRTLVGVVEDIRPLPGVPADPALMVPLTAADAPISVSSIVVAARTAAGVTLDRVALDRRLDEALGANSLGVKIVSELMPPHLQQPRFQAVLFGAVAIIGLIVAAVGLYAVTAFDVARRRFELSVRMSLGATAADVRRLVIRSALRPVLLGTAAGSIAAWWIAASLQSFLLEVNARDPWTAALVAVVLIATAVAAAWLPARRAAALEPAVVLRAG